MAFAAAAELMRPDRPGRLWWLLVTLPLAVPAPLIGIGLISLWNTPATPWLYGTDWMPVLAALARFTPPAALIALIPLLRLDPLLADAARVHQRHSIQRLTQVQIPMLAPGLIASAGVTFALTLGELGATLITVPPGKSTLAIRVYNYLHYGASASVAGLCLAMSVVVILAALLAMGALGAWKGLFVAPAEGEPIRR
jgi:iron(III) transport system permease protein